MKGKIENLVGWIVIFSFIGYFLYMQILNKKAKDNIIRNPDYIVGIIEKVVSHSKGATLYYYFFCNKKKYSKYQNIDKSQDYLLETQDLNILIIFNKNDPNQNEPLLDDSDFKEFKVPDSIIYKFFQ